MFYLRRGGHHVSKRCVSTISVPKETPVEAFAAKSYNEIPRVSTLRALWQLSFTEKKYRIDQVGTHINEELCTNVPN